MNDFDRLLDYIYGEMPSEEALEFRAKIEADPELQKELEELEGTRKAAAEGMKMPKDLERAILDEAYAHAKSLRWSNFWKKAVNFLTSPAFMATSGGVAVTAVAIAVFVVQDQGMLGYKKATHETSPVEVLQEAAHETSPVEIAQKEAATPPEQTMAAPVAEVDGPTVSQQEGQEIASPEPPPPSPPPAKKRAPTSTAPAVASRRASGGKTSAARFDNAETSAARVDNAETTAAGSSSAEPTEAKSSGTKSSRARSGAADSMAAPAFARMAPQHDRGIASLASQGPDRHGAMPDEMEEPEADDLLEMARGQKQAGRFAQALHLYRAALKLNPQGAVLFDLLAEAAEVSIKLDKVKEAENYLKRLEKLPGGKPRADGIREAGAA